MNNLKYNYIEPYPSREYSDFNIAFTRHPVTKDLSVKTDDDAIKQSLRNLVLLSPKEKPFHSEINGGIYNLLFENFEQPGNEEIAKQNLIALISQYEPRVDLNDVDFVYNYDQNSITLTIYYVIINTLVPSNVQIFLKTIR